MLFCRLQSQYVPTHPVSQSQRPHFSIPNPLQYSVFFGLTSFKQEQDSSKAISKLSSTPGKLDSSILMDCYSIENEIKI